MSAATTSTVSSTATISHQAGGWLAVPPWLATEKEQVPARDAEQSVEARRGQDLRSGQPGGDLLRGRAQGAGHRGRLPGVLHRRLGDEDGVDGGQGAQQDRDDQQHLVLSLRPRGETHVEQIEVGRARGHAELRDGQRGVGEEHGDDSAHRDGDAEHADQQPPGPPGGQPDRQQQRHGQPRRPPDQPGPAARRAGTPARSPDQLLTAQRGWPGRMSPRWPPPRPRPPPPPRWPG